MPTNSLRTEYLRTSASGRAVGVDREKNIVRGFLVAELGVFNDIPDPRGEFDAESLSMIAKMGNAAKQGLRSRFGHPTQCSDTSGLGNYIGRAKDFYLSDTINAEGQKVAAVRADLHVDETAMKMSPNGGTPRGEYILALAERDSAALGASLVIHPDRLRRKNPDGSLMLNESGEPVPPIWRPKQLLAVDIVDDPAATSSLLGTEVGIDGLDKAHLWQATDMLDGLFDGMGRKEVLERLTQFRDRYLNMRFGEEELAQPVVVPDTSEIELRLRRNRALGRAA